MKPFSEAPIKPDVPDTPDLPESTADRPRETKEWQGQIELPEDSDSWVDSIELSDESEGWQDSIDLDDLKRTVLSTSIERTDKQEGDYPSTYKERVDRTPRDDGERGDWQGERGESIFIPNDDDIKSILDEYGIEGIAYKDGIPDFSPCSESTVEIDNMTDNRSGPPVEGSNFQQCDQKCAEQWNEQCRDGRSDWTARDVANWRRENGYSWHERNDMKTCDLIPTKINAYFGHLGGVGEYIRFTSNNSAEGVFDE